MGKLKPFGKGTKAEEWGYDFSLVLGWLQSIVEEEGEMAGPRRMKIVEKAENACQLLNEIYEQTGCTD